MNPRDKAFKIPGDQVRRLIPNMGSCFASDRITVDGAPVGYMYREERDKDVDSGWRFFAGDESQEYADNPNNFGVYEVNTICNYDPAIISYLRAAVGSAFGRIAGTDRFEQEGFVGEDEDDVSSSITLNPKFPVAEGRCQMTSDWTVTLPGRFNRRIEDRSLVFWRPGITAWTVAWNNDNGQSQQERLDWLRRDTPPEAFDHEVLTDGGVIRFAYRLTEHREEGVVHALYAFAIGVDGHIQMAIYFDSESDLATARSMWRSLDEARLPSPDTAPNFGERPH